MGVHNDKTINKLLKEITAAGFRIVLTKKNVYKIFPPAHIEGPVYITHGTSKAYHPIKRDFKKFYNIDLKS